MATQVQFRRGTTAEHSTFTGVVGEITVDTTKDTLVVHDGSTAGGIPLAKDADKLNLTGGSVTGSVTGSITTDNDLSFDMSVTNNFKCTPTGTGVLTFTNITSGQSGNIWLDNSGGYVISAASSTYISAADLTTINTAGVYFMSYFSDGTNVMVSVTPGVTSGGA
jgi:hypothetical protein